MHSCRQVHHVVKCAQGGSDFDLDRLIALCPPCHAQTDAPYARGRLVITRSAPAASPSRSSAGPTSGPSGRSQRSSLGPALSPPCSQPPALTGPRRAARWTQRDGPGSAPVESRWRSKKASRYG